MSGYFKFSHPFIYFIIPFALILNFLSWYDHSLISPVYLGPIGRFAIFIGENHHQATVITNLFALIAHALEALWSIVLCGQKGIMGSAKWKWCAQTFLLGFGSLYLLIPYEKTKKRS